jgi:phytoene desaturase
VRRYIKDDRLRRVFSFHPLLVGGNPFQTTSIYTLILYLEKEWGVWFAMGGTGAIVNALETLFGELGGTVMLESEVDEILVDDTTRLSTGIRLRDGRVLASDAIVSNADVAFTYRNMLPARHRRKYTDAKIDRMKYSMSLFVLYFGTDRKYDQIPHHSIMLGERYEELLDGIFNRKHLADDFSLYLHRPTATDPSLAPEGCDAFYVLSPVPHLESGDDWNQVRDRYRDLVVNYLEQRYMPDLSKHIITEHIIDPLHFRDTLNSHNGSAFSIAPTLMQSAWMRPHNRSEDIANLYFVGAGTHPGAGMPGVISSAKIVADLIGSATGASIQQPTFAGASDVSNA